MQDAADPATPLPLRAQVQLYSLPEPAMLAAAMEQHFADWLSADERQRWQRFHHAADCRRFLLARALVRSVLAQRLQLPPAALQFGHSSHGKPELAQPADSALKFNLSHTRGLLVLGVTTGCEVGVDVEAMARDAEMLALASRFFSAAEVGLLRSLPAPQLRSAFFRLWTLKEAYVKARGLGLQLGLDTFSIDITPAAGARLVAGDDGARWSLFCYERATGYCVAVAANAPNAVCNLIDVDVESLV